MDELLRTYANALYLWLQDEPDRAKLAATRHAELLAGSSRDTDRVITAIERQTDRIVDALERQTAAIGRLTAAVVEAGTRSCSRGVR